MFSSRIIASLLLLELSAVQVSAQVIKVPHVDIYFLCQTTELGSDDTGILQTELSDFYLNLVPNSITATLEVESSIDGCIASDVVEIDINSDGLLTSTDLDLTTTDLEDLVTRDLLKEHFEPLCDSILAFEASIQAADSEPDEGLTSKVSSALCGVLSNDKYDLSAAAIGGIVAGALVIMCFLFFCCCCRRGRK